MFMKTIILKTANTLLIILFSASVFSQNLEDKTETQNFQSQYTTDINGLSNFSYKVVDKKVYFNFTVKNLKNDCVFVIERSTNGDKFKSVALKMGRANDKNINILYCFQDSINFEEQNAQYRLKQVFETEGTFYSETYTIKNDQYYFLADYK